VVNTLGEGLLAGAAGAVAMTVSEILEQRLTHRPDSFVPALTLGRLVRIPDEVAEESRALNLGMHLGQAAVLGLVRSMMAEGGLRGLGASGAFTGLRLMSDQILENFTGAGAPPGTWPRRELVLDVAHKAVYGLVTGLVADRLAARRGVGRGREHALRRPGGHSDVGPAPVS
jgi:hypothetical protein